jgi:MFS family permease
MLLRPSQFAAAAAAAAASLLQIAFGLIACLAVMYACSPAQLLQWGWRLPFLLTALFAPIALILRMHMPEPHDFLMSKQVSGTLLPIHNTMIGEWR